MKSVISAVIFWVGNILFFFRKRDLNIRKDEVKKILFISLFFRGDVLFQTPAIRILKYYFRNAEIDVWVKSRSEEIIRNNPDVNKIWVFDGVETDYTGGRVKYSLKEKLAFVRMLKAEKYDIVADYTGLFFTGLSTYLMKPKFSFGKFQQRFGFFYNKFIDEDFSIKAGHLIDKYKELVRLGVGIPETEWNSLIDMIPSKGIISKNDDKRKELLEILRQKELDLSKPLVTLHLTAGWNAKRWSLSGFAGLIADLKNIGFETAVIGTKEDRKEFESILPEINYLSPVKDSSGIFFDLPFEFSVELIRMSDVFIGSDSMPLHIAGAVDTPSIGLFGPTNPEFSRPLGEKHHVFYNQLYCSADGDNQYCTRDAGRTCATIDCMKMISKEQIVSLIKTIIKK
jgi:heptosyltransferase-3